MVSDYLQHLAEVPLFAGLSKRDLQKIAKASDEVTVEAGRELVTQGKTGRECFIILSGTARVTCNGVDVATLGPGEYFGELALLDGGPRTATVTAETELGTLVLTQRSFAGVIDEVPGLAHKLMSSLAARLRQLDKQHYG